MSALLHASSRVNYRCAARDTFARYARFDYQFLGSYPRTVVRERLAEALGYSRQHVGGKLASWQIALLERLETDADPKVADAARKARQRAIDRTALAP